MHVGERMALCFHIIYIPGTVKSLQLLLHSLLKWSDCTFRLVANGCGADEMSTLQRLCADNPRLSFMALPTSQLMIHGDALNYLQAQCQDDYFCFMDSDIYAVAPFMPDFLPRLAQYSGIFSGMPLRYPQSGLPLPTGKAFWAGPYTHSATGVCLGTTFFAIYNNQVVSEMRRRTGIGFTKYQWATIPRAYQGQIAALGLRHELYDTAKLFNLVLHLEGHALHYQPCTALRHIEAVSRFVAMQPASRWRRFRSYAGRWRRALMGQTIELTYDEALPHLSQVLQALADGQAVPPLPRQKEEGRAWIEQAQSELLALHAEFAPNSKRVASWN